ncbi:MAG: aminopeptidase N, partial [Kofleriaceae bacterium]|nr:aminopeptidase N [Kofleriaceae bacterium]
MNSADTQTTIYRADYTKPAYQIANVELTFDINAETTRVTTLFSMTQVDSSQPLVLVGQDLSLISVEVDGKMLSDKNGDFTQDDFSLTIPNLPAAFSLRTVVDIKPSENTALEGLYTSGDFLLTQCEAEGFRKITYFLDRPDVMTRYRVKLVADKLTFPVLLSNGNLSDSGDLEEGRHFAVWDDPFPKPSYLFALVAGDLAHVEEHYTTSEGRDVTLRIYVEKQNLGKVDHAMVSLKKSMQWDESRLGLSYDLDVYNIVATNDFNMGAMENKGLNVFNSKYVLANVDTATDADFMAIEAVIGHEYFHNWTGNRVTCRDWFQLSLKEGLTVFRDQEFSSDMQSRAVKRIADVRLLRSRQYSEDAGPMAHSVRPDSFVEINNFYTATIYIKGAEVVRMVHSLLGEELFQKGMTLYFERHDGQAVTCDDFRAAMADASGVNLEQFESWYKQAGTPVVKVQGTYDAQNKTYTLHFHQSTPDTPGQSDKPPHHMPVALGLVSQDGSDFPLQLSERSLSASGQGVELREREEVFVFTGIDHKPVPSLFRGLSAPVKVEFEYTPEELAFLMASDSDSFNRWDASQTLATEILFQLVANEKEEVPDLYLDAVGSMLQNLSDPGLISEALTLPDESYLAGVMADRGQVADVDGIHRSRTKLRSAIAAR